MDQKDICKISLEYTFISSTHWLLSRMMPWVIKPILTNFRKLGSLQVWVPTIIELNKKSISKKKTTKSVINVWKENNILLNSHRVRAK